MTNLDPNLLLRAYAIGVFPMADSRSAADVYWVEPNRRAIMPLSDFSMSRSLAKVIRRDELRVTRDAAFPDVIAACAERRPDRADTWINPDIETAYCELHRRGYCHSIECWQGDDLVGGLYGVKLGAAFFGESMFSRVSNASKVALAHLVARLKAGGFVLLDCQFMTEHLASLGAIEISKADYSALLDSALSSLGGSAGSSPADPASLPGSAGADVGALERSAGAGSGGALSGQVIAQALG